MDSRKNRNRKNMRGGRTLTPEQLLEQSRELIRQAADNLHNPSGAGGNTTELPNSISNNPDLDSIEQSDTIATTNTQVDQSSEQPNSESELVDDGAARESELEDTNKDKALEDTQAELAATQRKSETAETDEDKLAAQAKVVDELSKPDESATTSKGGRRRSRRRNNKKSAKRGGSKSAKKGGKKHRKSAKKGAKKRSYRKH
jgi:hypothetical protein